MLDRTWGAWRSPSTIGKIACALLAAVQVAASATAAAQVQQPHQQRPVVLIYAGKPVCNGCEHAIVSLLEQPKNQSIKQLRPQIKVIKTWSAIPRSLRALPKGSVLVIPGTDDDLRAWAPGGKQAMNVASIKAIQGWIKAGGRYAGICGGAVIAQARYADEDTTFDALNIAPMVADNFPNEDAIERLERIVWLPSGQKVDAYFQAGSVMTLQASQERSVILAQYEKSNGKVPHAAGIAAALFSYGKGKVFVSGVHLEATADFWNKPPARFVARTDLLEQVFADLMSDKPVE